MIENTGDLVDKIYLSHSRVPWSAYNKLAIDIHQSTMSIELIADFPHKEKIVWLEGIWKTEEDQRNHSLDRARADGMDYMIIQDADEFYHPNEFSNNLKEIASNPNYPVYRCPWIVFWKDLKHVIQVRNTSGNFATITTCPNFAINLNMSEVRFVNRRLVAQMDQAYQLSGLCYHLAWVLSDDSVLKKIETWGHSHQFNYMKWFKHKWLAWREETRYIGTISRANYLKAIRFEGTIPAELKGLPSLEQRFVPLSIIEKIDNLRLDVQSLISIYTRVGLSKLKSLLRVVW
jgi:hypothetical protein